MTIAAVLAGRRVALAEILSLGTEPAFRCLRLAPSVVHSAGSVGVSSREVESVKAETALTSPGWVVGDPEAECDAVGVVKNEASAARVGCDG